MQLKTDLQLSKSEQAFSYADCIYLSGSCFTEHIGNRLNRLKFKVLSNSHGVLFNPVSILQSLRDVVEKRIYTRDELFEHNGIWSSYHHHSSFSSVDPQKCLDTINGKIQRANANLLKSRILMISLGSAYVYEHKKQKRIVGNCHKVPNANFNKKLLSVADCVTAVEEITKLVVSFNPNAQLIFTVSPVRHLKDGWVENQRSKSHLINAVHSVVETFKKTHYFPAYELLMDDLRDYRFYEKDMLHPNELAIDYIWEKFATCWITDESLLIMGEVEKLITASEHRPFLPESEIHQNFLKVHLLKLAALQQKENRIDFQQERALFEAQLIRH